ncbi:MAG: hypothetical protein ACIALR_13020 [Blastopirellula sp. JB062]
MTRLSFALRAATQGAILGIFCLLIGGCGSQPEGEPRFRVSGKITFQGNPIPAGLVTFSPDASLGNRGSQGVARIENGQFDTGGDGGKGALAGPQVVKVIGSDGKPYSDDAGIESAEGKPLFAPWETKLEVKEEDVTIDIEVPQSAKR